MALGPYYINGAINTDTGTGASGDPFGSWTQLVATIGTTVLSSNGGGIWIVYMKGKCTTGNVATGRFNIDGMTGSTFNVNYMKFMPWPGFEGDGTVANTPGFSSAPSDNEYVFRIPTNGVAERICIEQTSTSSAKACLDMFTRAGCRAQGCIIKNAGTNAAVTLLCDNNSSINDSLIITAAGIGLFGNNAFATSKAYGNTIVTTAAGGEAVRPNNASYSLDIRNTAIYGSFTTEFTTTATYVAACTNNAGQIAAASQPAAINDGTYVQLVADPFNNRAANDYRPKTGSALLAAGVGGTTTVDALNVARGTPSTLGAFEVAAAGGIPVMASQHRRRR